MFRCPECLGRTRVLRTVSERGGLTRRRRCQACGFRLTTHERRAGEKSPLDVAAMRIPIAELVRIPGFADLLRSLNGNFGK